MNASNSRYGYFKLIFTSFKLALPHLLWRFTIFEPSVEHERNDDGTMELAETTEDSQGCQRLLEEYLTFKNSN